MWLMHAALPWRRRSSHGLDWAPPQGHSAGSPVGITNLDSSLIYASYTYELRMLRPQEWGENPHQTRQEAGAQQAKELGGGGALEAKGLGAHWMDANNTMGRRRGRPSCNCDQLSILKMRFGGQHKTARRGRPVCRPAGAHMLAAAQARKRRKGKF